MRVFDKALVAGRAARLVFAGACLTAIGIPAASAPVGFPGPAPGSAPGTNTPGVRLKCWPVSPVSKAGGPVKIRVEVVNGTKAPVLMPILFYPVPETQSGAETPPLKIECYDPVRHFFPHYTAAAGRPSLPRTPTKLRPGASVGATFDLTKFYRLPAGTYNVRVFYDAPPSAELPSVKSVNFRITP